MSDIWVKRSTGTSSTTWSKAANIFVKTATGTSSAAWSAVKNVYVRFSSGWTRVWPLSGVFNVTSPYIATSSGSTTPLYGVDGVRRVGSTVWGKNGTWNANGWVINSYQYRWRAYSSSAINDLNIYSQTTLATYSSAVSLSIPATYDRKYLSFFIQANSSGGTAYNGYAESGVEYGGIQIVRQQPINLTKTISTFNPKVGDIISYSSSWNTTDAYAPEASRTTIEWYKNLSNSTSGGTFITSGNYSYTVQSSDLNHYIYAVETTYNSGTDYDLGTSTGISVSVITLSTVTAGLSAPTSVSISSVSRSTDSTCDAYIAFSGGSGPYYQMYWASSVPAPVTDAYDAAGTGSPILETFGFASGITYNFYIRSSSQNLGNTVANGSAASGTYSPYSTAYASYTFQAPTISSSSISPSSGTAGSTTFFASATASGSPSATLTYQWQYLSTSFTYVNISGATSSSYTPPSNFNTLYPNYGFYCLITASNGVSSNATARPTATLNSPVSKLSTPTGVSASDTRTDGVLISWNAVSGAAYYGIWWGGPPGYDNAPDFGGPSSAGGWNGSGTSFLDTTISAGSSRSYYVQAYASGNPAGTKSDWGGGDTGTRASTPPPAAPQITSGPSISWSSGNNFTLSATASNATNIEFEVQFANTSGGTVQATQTYFVGASVGTTTTGAQSYSWARTRARANNTSTGQSSSFTAYTNWA